MKPATIPARSPEEIIGDQWEKFRSRAQDSWDDVGARAQVQPHRALLSAVAVGYLLRLLPVTRIVGGVIGLMLTLLKPAAIVYGAAKLWQATQRKPESIR